VDTDRSIELVLLGEQWLAERLFAVHVRVLRLEERLGELVELGARERRLALHVT